MAVTETVGESRDGAGSGDHDLPFTFGEHGRLLKPWEFLHMLLLRGRVKDAHDRQDQRDDPEAP